MATAPVYALAWSSASPTLAICAGEGGGAIQILRAQGASCLVGARFALLQLAPQQLALVRIGEPIETVEVRLDIAAVGFHLYDARFVVWTDDQVSRRFKFVVDTSRLCADLCLRDS